MKRYEPVEHTADIGIRVYGKDLKELFLNAAYGMFDAIADLKHIKPSTELKVSIEAANKEELLVAWLRELLYKYSVENFICIDFKIKNLSENRLEAFVSCAKNIDQKYLKHGIKAVTYCDLHINKIGDHFETPIIFDI